MPYIAKTNGGNTAIEIRSGYLVDIEESERVNWRTVQEIHTAVDNWTTIRTFPKLTVNGDGSQVNLVWQTAETDAVWNKMRLKDYAADIRWQKQQGGITFNGIKIKTDDESQAKIHQAFSILKEGWVQSIDFKTASGFVTVDLATITAIAQAVAAHVQSCFTKEKAVIEAIDAGTITNGSDVENWEWL